MSPCFCSGGGRTAAELWPQSWANHPGSLHKPGAFGQCSVPLGRCNCLLTHTPGQLNHCLWAVFPQTNHEGQENRATPALNLPMYPQFITTLHLDLGSIKLVAWLPGPQQQHAGSLTPQSGPCRAAGEWALLRPIVTQAQSYPSHTHVHPDTSTKVHRCACKFTHVCLHMSHLYTCGHIYTHVQMHVHTDIHAYTSVCLQKKICAHTQRGSDQHV